MLECLYVLICMFVYFLRLSNDKDGYQEFSSDYDLRVVCLNVHTGNNPACPSDVLFGPPSTITLYIPRTYGQRALMSENVNDPGTCYNRHGVFLILLKTSGSLYRIYIYHSFATSDLLSATASFRRTRSVDPKLMARKYYISY